MPATLLPNAKAQFIDNTGKPLVGGKVYFYIPNTSTLKNTYQDAAQTILNTNPVVLDANGQALIWGSGTYRQVVYDQNGNLIWDQITQSPNANLTGNVTDQVFVAGTDFTPGVTTQLALSTGPGSIANTWVFFDSLYQDDLQTALSGTSTLVFASPIPVGVQHVTVKVGTTIAIGTPSNGTVKDEAVAANAGIQSSKLSYRQGAVGSVVRTVLSRLQDSVSIVDFGAMMDGTTDDTAAWQAAINSGVTLIKVPAGTSVISSTITLPQGTYLKIQGAGFRLSTIKCETAGITAFKYARGAAASASIFEFTGLAFVLDPIIASASLAISSYGYSDALSDNELRIRDCYFVNWTNAIQAKWTGQTHIDRCWFQGNNVDLNCLRGCNQWYLTDNMSFSPQFISVVDTVYDSFTNGWVLRGCNNITATGTNCYFEGVQAIYIAQCGFDLGSGGSAALWFYKSRDIAIVDSFITSNGVASRDGIRFDNSFRGRVSGCSIYNNLVGIRLGPSIPTVGQSITIDDNVFDGQISTGNDILFMGSQQGCKITNNHFAKQLARSGTAYEIYITTTGTQNNVVLGNTFAGSNYSVTSDPNTYVAGNIFGVLA